MSVSHREKIMLLALLLVAVIAAGYYFVFVPVMEKSDELDARMEDVQLQADEIEIELAALPRVQEEVQNYETSLADLSARFYPEIIQEKLILQVDDFIKESGIVASVYSYSMQEGLTITNFQTNETSTVESDQQSETETTTQENSTNTAANEIQSAETTIPDATVLSVNMQFSGSYDQLREFISLVEKSGRAIYLSDLTYQVEYTETENVNPEVPTPTDTQQTDEPTTEDGNQEPDAEAPDTQDSPATEPVVSGVRGSFTIDFYSIQKDIDQDADYYKW
jgi:type IV pilus assembly protein PilO